LRKIQQFYLFKLSSARLKDKNYKIEGLIIDEARMDGELISISNSEMVRTVLRVTHREFSQYKLDGLLDEKKKISNRRNTRDNRERITQPNNEIDDMLFIPDIISVSFDDRRHFKNILDRNGFHVNGKRYIPFMASAGMVRRDISLFIDSDIYDEVDVLFNNDRNRDVEIVPAKFLAYYSLYSSSTIPVSFPRIAVVPDMTITATKKVDFSTYQGVGLDPLIEEREMEMEFNAFDGQGLCSPQFAKQMGMDLEMDYVPSVIGVRAPFLKGMLCVFDFNEFADRLVGDYTFTDIYGDSVDVRDVDCLISESQFKLWSSYSSTKQYVDACKRNGLGFGITKVNPKVEKNHAKTSYQFLQVLNLSDEQIERLCQPTLDWLNEVSSGDIYSVLLYLLGETKFSDHWFERLDYITQALLLEHGLLNDSYFIRYLNKTISRKKNDAKIGRLILNGNYQVAVADPYAFCAHVFGLGVTPLLQAGEHYSEYWNKKQVSQVACIRSPIVHSSELNILNFRTDEMVKFWYQHIQSGIVFPANGVGMDAAINGGMDFDLDLVCTLDSPEIIDGRIDNLPVMYENKKAEKIKLKEDYKHLIHESQERQIKTNKIGFLTNVSSSLYALLDDFEEGSREHTVIENRLKYGRVSQGLAIDSTKGILTDPFPEHFVKWKRITDDMGDDEAQLQKFYNRILADKRPYFMIWLYPHYRKKYMQEIASYDTVSRTRWKLPFAELLEKCDRTPEQESLVRKYRKRTFFIDNNSVMNRISRHMDESMRKIKHRQLERSADFDYHILVSESFVVPSPFVVEKARLLFKEWKSLNKSLRDRTAQDDENAFQSFDDINRYINKRAYATISSNASELADIFIYLCYHVLGIQSRSFAWRCFGKEMVDNIKSKRNEKFVRVPFPSEGGNRKYLWTDYKVFQWGIGDY